MRKPAFGICKNKGAEQLHGNRAAYQCFCFCYMILQYIYEPRCEKTAFCICENKDADQLHGNCEADQRLCFCYMDSTIPLLPKSERTSHEVLFNLPRFQTLMSRPMHN